MKIEILGSGCPRCETLFQNALQAAGGINPSSRIEVFKITDVNYFTQKGVTITPGLVIDGEVVSTGQLLSAEEILAKIKERV
jgi:small redox-active disulfide protein 2